MSFAGFELNVKAPPFDNLNVRQAVAWGVNREEILNTVLKGVGVLAQGPLSPGSWAYDSSFTPYSYDTNKAKAALQQSGQSNVSFTLLIASGSPLNTQEAEFIQSELKPVGITVNIKEEVFATLLDDTAAHTSRQRWSAGAVARTQTAICTPGSTLVVASTTCSTPTHR